MVYLQVIKFTIKCPFESFWYIECSLPYDA